MKYFVTRTQSNSRTYFKEILSPNKNNIIQPAVGSSTTHSFNAFDSVPWLIEIKINKEMSFKFCYKKSNQINKIIWIKYLQFCIIWLKKHPLIIYNLFKRFSLG